MRFSDYIKESNEAIAKKEGIPIYKSAKELTKDKIRGVVASKGNKLEDLKKTPKKNHEIIVLWKGKWGIGIKEI